MRLLKGENNRSIYRHICASLPDAQLLLFYSCDSTPIFPRKATTHFSSGGSDPLFLTGKNIVCALERAACHQVYAECLLSFSLWLFTSLLTKHSSGSSKTSGFLLGPLCSKQRRRNRHNHLSVNCRKVSHTQCCKTFAHLSILVSKRLLKACSLQYTYMTVRNKHTHSLAA